MSVLVAIDGLSQTEAALRLSAQIARRGHKPLTILTVIKHEANRSPVPADTILSWAREIVQPQSPDTSTRVRIGHAATEIVREAEEGNYDLVIVGERPNRNLVARFLLGSTAVRVVEHAPCPVIVAKGKIAPIQRILLCDSGSEDPSVELSPTMHPSTVLGPGRTGSTLLSRFIKLSVDLLDGTGEIVVLHVMSQMSAGPGVAGKQLRSNAQELIGEHAPEGTLLEGDLEALEKLGIRAQARVRHGLVVDEILAEAKSGDYDLVAIGAYRGEGWQRILLDDQAHRIVIQLDRPVMVLR